MTAAAARPDTPEKGTAVPAFETPGPILLTLRLDIGTVRVTATDRTDTTVEIAPADPAVEADVRMAERTEAVRTAEGVSVKAPRNLSPFATVKGSVSVHVALPAGSDVRARTEIADLVCAGDLGRCDLRTSVGEIVVEHAAAVRLGNAHGSVRVDHVAGRAEVSGSDRVRLGRVEGDATVTNLSGEVEIEEVRGDLSVTSANGRIRIGGARAGLEVRSGYGDVRVAEVVQGEVALRTGSGHIEVGVREDTAAWLDLDTRLGRIHRSQETADGPGDAEHTVRITARTGLGDITVHPA